MNRRVLGMLLLAGLGGCGASSQARATETTPTETTPSSNGNGHGAAPVSVTSAGDSAVAPTVGSIGPILAGIHRISPQETTITRAALDQILGELDTSLGATRGLAETRQGREIGFHLVGVEPGAVMSALGFEEDDVVVSVGGYEMTTPDRVLEAYTLLRSATLIPIEVERRGTRQPLTIRVVP